MKTPLRARLKKCVACGQAKPLTEYTARGHKSCSACIAFTHGGNAHTERSARAIVDMLRRKASKPVSNSTSSEIYTAPELRAPVRPGAMDAMALPSRMGDRLYYRDGRVEII